MRRLAATILLAGLAAFAISPPFADSWQCPDGTPCRYTGGATFECASRSSDAQQSLPPCCRKKKQRSAHCCRHGVLLSRVHASSFPSPRLMASDEACRCQFVPLNVNCLSALQPKSSAPMPASEAPIPFVYLLSFSPQSEFLSPENDSLCAREGLPLPISRAPPPVA
jgi:hypothetical protein